MPIREVIAFMGMTYPLLGSWEMMSLSSIMHAPSNSECGMIFRWMDVSRSRRLTCGTAIPTKPIGPVNAVDTPVRNTVSPISMSRLFLTSTPTDCASCSPNKNASIGFIKNTMRMTPINMHGSMILSCVHVTVQSEPNVQFMNILTESGSLICCNMLMSAVETAPIIIPIIRRVAESRMRMEAMITDRKSVV